MAGIKFARNTRASLKRLFAKVKAAAHDETSDNDRVGEAGRSKDASETEEDEQDDESSLPETIPVKKQKKGIAVKKNAAGKRSSVTKKVTPSRGKAAVSKSMKPMNEDSDDDEGEGQSNDGKFIILTFHPHILERDPCNISANGSRFDYQISMTDNETYTLQRSEEADAEFRGMTVEEWRAWKTEHNYDAYHSYCPTPVWRLSEKVA